MFQRGYTEIPTINNSWFKFDRNNKGFTAGNIYLNEEMNLNGRGLTINLGDSAAFNTVQFGAMDKSYSLYDPNEIYTPGWSGFVKSNHIFGDENPTKYQVFAAYDKDSRNFSESYLVFNEIEKSNYSSTQFIKSYKFQLGAGLNRAYIPENFTSTLPTETPANSSFKPSLAGGWQVQGSWKRFFASSGAYFSGGYFPGHRRGTLQLSQRIGWRIKTSSIWGEYQLNSFEPQIFNPLQPYSPKFRIEKMEMGLSFPLNSFSNISIAPRLENENGVYFLPNQQIGQYDAKGIKIISNLYWRSRNSKHYVTATNEAGKQIAGTFAHVNKWNSLTNISYNFFQFQLTGQHQVGSFSVTDYLYSDFLSITPGRYSLSGNWNQELFRNRVKAQIYYTYYKDNAYGSGHSIQSRLQYKWNQTELFAVNQMQLYKSRGLTSTPYLDLQVGITQKFISNSKNNKTGNLDIRVFYDHNQNGIYDAGDEVSERKSLLIQQILFQTDRNGKVSYKRIPYGDYAIQVPVENNWYAANTQVLINKSNQKVDIPLRKASSLRGRIVYDYDPLRSLEADIVVEGFSIIAKSSTGETWRTRTDNSGNYMLFLPAGEYTLSINEIELPQNVYIDVNHLYIKTETGQVNSAPDFVFKVKERSIEIRRFGS